MRNNPSFGQGIRKSTQEAMPTNWLQQYIAYLNSLTADDPRKHVATIAEIQSFWTEIFLDERQDLKHRLRASELLAKAKGMFNTESW